MLAISIQILDVHGFLAKFVFRTDALLPNIIVVVQAHLNFLSLNTSQIYDFIFGVKVFKLHKELLDYSLFSK